MGRGNQGVSRGEIIRVSEQEGVEQRDEDKGYNYHDEPYGVL